MSDLARYEIHDPEIEMLLRSLAKKIGGELPGGWGFMLMLFQFSEATGAPMFDISNADRKDVANVVREWLQEEAAKS